MSNARERPGEGPATAPEIEWLGDAALRLCFGARIDAALNAQVLNAAAAIVAARIPAVVDVVPAYASLTLHLDRGAAASESARILAAIEVCLLGAPVAQSSAPAHRRVLIPVAYGSACGADLERVAQHAGIAPEDVIARHLAVEYTVAMIGFQPGFPYLLGLDSTLATPRHAQPRTQVLAGSVGIGGAQTGIYPAPSPGGWNLIGRTAVRLFDPARDRPSLLAPGDRVRFRRVEPAQLDDSRAEIAP